AGIRCSSWQVLSPLSRRTHGPHARGRIWRARSRREYSLPQEMVRQFWADVARRIETDHCRRGGENRREEAGPSECLRTHRNSKPALDIGFARFETYHLLAVRCVT